MKFCDKEIQEHFLNGGYIERKSDNFPLFLDRDGRISYNTGDYIHTYNLNEKDLIADDWEIIPEKWNWKKIIRNKILCQFWDDDKNDEAPIVGYLVEKTGKKFIRSGSTGAWKNCEPFDAKKFNIAQYILTYTNH